MTKPIVLETDLQSGKTIEREMTENEIQAREAIIAETSQAIADSAARVSQKMALLERLGLTADEAVLLLK